MALSDNYIVGVNLGEYFVDKTTGEPLSGGTIEFFRDSDRLTPKAVYELVGSPGSYSYTALPNPMTLSSVGTPMNNSNENVAIYFYPLDADGDIDNYFIRVRDSSGAEQFTRQAWPNITEENSPVDEGHGVVTNELGNPQFVDVYFDPANGISHTMTTTSETVEIGPDWVLELASSTSNGSVTINRIALAGSEQDPGEPSDAQIINAPYALEIAPGANLDTIVLRQRLSNNPGLFSAGNLAAYLIAKSQTIPTSLSMQWQDSDGSVAGLGSLNLITSDYSEFKTNTAIPASVNPATGDTGYVDIRVILPTTATVRVSSIQIVGTNSDADPVAYDQEPVNRQQDHTWHNYKESVIIQPKASILTAWDFGLNPWQMRSSAVAAMGSQAEYVADQTIIVAENASMLNVGRANSQDIGALFIEPGGGTQGHFAIVQYIDKETIRPYWGYALSSLMRAVLVPSTSNTLKFKMDLLRSTTAPTTVSPIVSWGNSTSDNTYTAQWSTVIQSENNTEWTISQNSSLSMGAFPYYSFNNFQLPYASGTDDYLAIVLWLSSGTLSAGDALHISTVSLVPNDFAIESNPQTSDQVLRECQYYYEKSMAPDVYVGDTSPDYDSVITANQHVEHVTTTLSGYARQFSYNFKQTKRAAPDMTFYSPFDWTVDNVYARLEHGSSPVNSANAVFATYFNEEAVSSQGFYYTENTNSVMIQQTGVGASPQQGCYIAYHYIANAQLGV